MKNYLCVLSLFLGFFGQSVPAGLGDFSAQGQLLGAIRQGNLGLVKSLVQHGAGDKFVVAPASGATLLHIVMQCRPDQKATKLDIVKYLVEVVGIPVDAKDERGLTPLDYLALPRSYIETAQQSDDILNRKEDLEIAKYLIENGADVNARSADGMTPLHYVNNVEIAKLLVEKGSDPNAEDLFGFKPLYYAGNRHNVDVAKCLVEAGKVKKAAAIQTSEIGQLSQAVKGNNFELVRMLVAANKELLLHRDEEGLLPIEWAGNKLEIAKFMKEQGSPVPETLLYYAFGSGSLPVAKWLIDELKSDLKKQLANLVDVARRNGQEHMLEYLTSLGFEVQV